LLVWPPAERLWIGRNRGQFARLRRTPARVGTGPEAAYPRVAAQPRMVSVARIRLDSGKSVRPFKDIICDDVSEFESHMPSQPVWSPPLFTGAPPKSPRARDQGELLLFARQSARPYYSHLEIIHMSSDLELARPPRSVFFRLPRRRFLPVHRRPTNVGLYVDAIPPTARRRPRGAVGLAQLLGTSIIILEHVRTCHEMAVIRDIIWSSSARH
jgi:hypothetical protein